MRTTLNLDDDVLEAARAIAHVERRSVGMVLSDLARRGLVPHAPRIDDDGRLPGVSRECRCRAHHRRHGACGAGGSLTDLLDVNLLVSIAWPITCITGMRHWTVWQLTGR
jgi:hypothetical protein